MPTQLTAHAVTSLFHGRTVLDAVSCTVPPGACTGVVGENGSGKSTLLRLFAGALTPDEGEIVVSAAGGVGYLAQEAQLPPAARVADVLDEALHELRAIERRLRWLETVMSGEAGALAAAGPPTPLASSTRAGREGVLAEYGELGTVFEMRGGYDTDARVARALHGLGLAGVPRESSVAQLSGGEQVRLRLAALLVASPEVLLLDEPTNHLDIQHQLELLTLIVQTPVTTVVALHDLNLAAMFCDHLVVLDGGSVATAGTPAEVLTEELIGEVYGVRSSVTPDGPDGRPSVRFLPPRRECSRATTG